MYIYVYMCVYIYIYICISSVQFSRVQLLEIPWTAAYQAPPFMGFSRQEYLSGVPSPSALNLF